jgi:NAD-dependent dihydropyrimidine dehydrogenase PreA subunit
MQQVPEDGRANSSSTSLLEHVQFPLRQLSVDMLTNWGEPEHGQGDRPNQGGLTEIHHTTPLPPPQTTVNFDTVSEGEGVSTADVVARIHREMSGDEPLPGAKTKKRRSLKPQPETWKKNVRKAARAMGKAYQSSNGKLIPARQVKPVDCAKCRLRCPAKISEEARRVIFESYWGTASYIRQRDFICSHIIEDEKARCTVKEGMETRKREVSRQYWLPEKNGKLHRVCKSFFIATLDIGPKIIDCAMKKRQGFGFFCDEDKRGKHEPSNKLPEEKLDIIRNHIESFRHLNISPNKKKKNGRIVLPAEYNIRKMFQMYQEYCIANGDEAQKEHTYRRIFNMEYNIVFEESNKDMAIRQPGDASRFLKRPAASTASAPAPGPSTSSNSAPQPPKKSYKPRENSATASSSHQSLVNQHMEQVRMAETNEQIRKERNRQISLMNSQSQSNKQQQQHPSESVHTSLSQHIITSHAMPQYSSAPPPAHFVLPSNHGRSLDAVNMTVPQFPMHPSLLHHHHHSNN